MHRATKISTLPNKLAAMKVSSTMDLKSHSTTSPYIWLDHFIATPFQPWNTHIAVWSSQSRAENTVSYAFHTSKPPEVYCSLSTTEQTHVYISMTAKLCLYP